MPFEKDQHDVDVSAVPETPDADDRPDQEAKPRRRLRWLGIAIAGAVLLLGIVSLLSALSRRGGEPEAADLNTLRSTIASEEEQLRDLQAELDNAEKALADKQSEYDKAKAEAEAGQPDAAGAQQFRQGAEDLQAQGGAGDGAVQPADRQGELLLQAVADLPLGEVRAAGKALSKGRK